MASTSDSGGSDSGRDTDVGTGGGTFGGTTVGIDAPWLGDGWSMATTGTTGDGTSDGSGSDSGSGSSGSGGSESGGSGSDTDTGGGGGGEVSGLQSLDWRYVCSDHVDSTGTSERVDGLENGKEYQFLVVSYDIFGNPRIVSPILTAIPIETSDFWEQCEQQGDLCGSGGFCNCTSDPEPMGVAWLGAGLVMLGVARRRREPVR